jgi:hypothetical protein
MGAFLMNDRLISSRATPVAWIDGGVVAGVAVYSAYEAISGEHGLPAVLVGVPGCILFAWFAHWCLRFKKVRAKGSHLDVCSFLLRRKEVPYRCIVDVRQGFFFMRLSHSRRVIVVYEDQTQRRRTFHFLSRVEGFGKLSDVHPDVEWLRQAAAAAREEQQP